MKETLNPSQLAQEMVDAHQHQKRVNAWVDVSHQLTEHGTNPSLDDFNAIQDHLEVMEQRTGDEHYDQTQDNPYEQYSLRALARIWAEAEDKHDTTIVEDVTDVIMERIDEHVAKAEEAASNREDALIDRANTDFHGQWLDRVVAMKDEFKQKDAEESAQTTASEQTEDTAHFDDDSWYDEHHQEWDERERKAQKQEVAALITEKEALTQAVKELKDIARNRTKTPDAKADDQQENDKAIPNRSFDAVKTKVKQSKETAADKVAALREKAGQFIGRVIARGRQANITEQIEMVSEDTDSGELLSWPNRAEEARDIKEYELVRVPGNNNKDVDPVYIENQHDVRDIFVDALKSGEMYQDTETFINVLKTAHIAASANNVYRKVGDGQMPFEEKHRGVMRNEDEDMAGVISNGRYPEAESAALIAARYGDPYAERLDVRGKMALSLPGVASENQAYDVLEDNGYLEYKFSYPHSDAIPQYMNQAHQIGVGIAEELQSDEPDTDKLIDLVARQYQYLAVARPFNQINNSIFMNLANAQLRAAGLWAMPHQDLDTLSHHLQADSFAKLFADRLKNYEPAR